MEIDPELISPAERYKLLIGAVVPRPIAYVSTASPDGRNNLAPFSFFNAIGGSPMLLMFCPANNAEGGEKDTLRNADATGEFVVNIASEAYERTVAASAEALEYGESEFELVGLTPAPSTRVRPPRVAESPLSFECETVRVDRFARGRPGGANIVIGRVVFVHAADGLVNERFHVDADMLGAIGRMGGREYCRTRDRFEMPVGRSALEEAPPRP